MATPSPSAKLPFSIEPEPVKTYSFQQLLGHERKPETGVIVSHGLLKRNSIMVVGATAKAYKSFVTGSMCCDLAVGRNLFGAFKKPHGRVEKCFNVAEPQRVLIFEQEIGEDDLEDRLKPIYQSMTPVEQKLMAANLFTHSLDHTMQLDVSGGVNAIARVIQEVNPTIVVFDPLIEFHTSDENSTKDMAKILRAVDFLRQTFRVAIIINHHEGKAPANGKSEREGGDRLRGNSVVFGKGDTFLMLRVVNRNAMIIHMEFTIRRGKPMDGMTLQIDRETLVAGFQKWGKPDKKKTDSETALSDSEYEARILQ